MNVVASSSRSTNTYVSLTMRYPAGAGVHLAMAAGTRAGCWVINAGRVVVASYVADYECSCVEDLLPAKN